MFEGSSEYKYRGESSVMYLPFPEITIRNIKKYLNKDVKIIIMLRNPVERAFAGYLHNVRYNTSLLLVNLFLHEDLDTTFQTLWAEKTTWQRKDEFTPS